MPSNTIGLRFNVDISQARSQVGELSREIADLRNRIAEATRDANITGDFSQVNQLYQALNNAVSGRGQIMNQARQLESDQARENKRNGGIFGGSDMGDFGKYLLSQTITKLADNIVQAIHKGFQIAQQRAGGDFTGAAISEAERTAELTDNAVGAIAGAIGMYFGGPLAAAISASLGKGIASLFTGKTVSDLKEDLIYSQQYKKIFPDIDSLNQIYGGDINKKERKDNTTHGLQMYGRATEAADWTGLTTSQFIEAMKQMGGYGVKEENQALIMAQNQARWSFFTGVDLSSIQKLAGQAYRYGGDARAVSTAYGGLLASGMGKGQYSEFLNSMARVMEEGVSKGFMKSSDKIAGNMIMLYKLSGNSALWQGEQGAQRLSQMNNAIANATKLESVEDIISFAAVKEIFNSKDFNKADFEKSGGKITGSYVDYMQLLERGLDSKLLGKQFEAVRNISGGDTADMIERFRNMYGLNYTGAAQVWGMAEEWRKDPSKYTPETIKKEIEAMQTNPGYASDSALLNNIMNKVADTLANIGQIKFEQTELDILRNQADNVKEILEELRSGRPPTRETEADLPGKARDYFVTSEVSEDPWFNKFQTAYNKLVEPYRENTTLFNNLMGNGNISEFSRYLIEEANFDKVIDNYEQRELMDKFQNAIEDFKHIINSFNTQFSTGFKLPDRLEVYMMD
jgi:hypothetical protein